MTHDGLWLAVCSTSALRNCTVRGNAEAIEEYWAITGFAENLGSVKLYVLVSFTVVNTALAQYVFASYQVRPSSANRLGLLKRDRHLPNLRVPNIPDNSKNADEAFAKQNK